MAEHHEGTIHLVGGMSPDQFRDLVDRGEIDPLTGRGLAEHGIEIKPAAHFSGSAQLSGEGNPA